MIKRQYENHKKMFMVLMHPIFYLSVMFFGYDQRKRIMSKKIVSIILILAGILCVCSVCHAELINALYGDCDQNTYQFYFQAEGNSSITFVQYPGKEKGIFEHDGGIGALFSYNENGLYHITYGLVGKSTKTVDWENVFSFNDYDTYVLNLKDPGVYRITIDPYSDEEINNVYAIDHFGGWDKYPSWHVDHCDGGRLSLENDFTYSHSTTADYDTFAESGSYYTTPTNCPHSSTYTELFGSEICDQGNVDVHVVVDHYYDYCSNCGAYIKTEDHYREENHSYSGSSCIACGYTKSQSPNSSDWNYSEATIENAQETYSDYSTYSNVTTTNHEDRDDEVITSYSDDLHVYNGTTATTGDYQTNMREVSDWINGKIGKLVEQPYMKVRDLGYGADDEILYYFNGLRELIIAAAYYNGSINETKDCIILSRDNFVALVYNGEDIFDNRALSYNNMSITGKRELLDIGLALFSIDFSQTYSVNGKSMNNNEVYEKLVITRNGLY